MHKVLITMLLASTLAAAQALDCAANQNRALVLSGGGARGAFQAGAVYHLVVHRHCDFKEISGVSVGALNGSFLAQAASSADPAQSLSNLAEQAEALVAVWTSIRGPQDVFKARHLGMLRFGLFKLEYLNDFAPLRNLISDKVSPARLLTGRTVRVGVVSFWDGRYREVVASSTSVEQNKLFLDYVFASSLVPIYGQMPQIQDDPAITDRNQWPQFADAGLRRVTPVSSYFMNCDTAPAPFDTKTGIATVHAAPCDRQGTRLIPAHQKAIRQLFVVIASPYSRASDQSPIQNVEECCDRGTHRFTDGHKIMERTISLAVGLPYRWDIDFAQLANEFLRWRQEEHNALLRVVDPGKIAEFQESTRGLNADFPVESYNPDDTAAVPSLPYEIRLIIPDKVFADVYGFDPQNIREQLYCGCLAADQMMSRPDATQSMSVQCAQRFPQSSAAGHQPKPWETDVCRVTPSRNK